MQPSEPEPLESGVLTGVRASLPFRLALVPTALFIVTVLAFTAAQFGDPEAPAQQWLDRNVGWLLAAEVLASALLCLLALANDRRRIVERATGQSPDDA
jgi:hypothetical protein